MSEKTFSQVPVVLPVVAPDVKPSHHPPLHPLFKLGCFWCVIAKS